MSNNNKKKSEMLSQQINAMSDEIRSKMQKWNSLKYDKIEDQRQKMKRDKNFMHQLSKAISVMLMIICCQLISILMLSQSVFFFLFFLLLLIDLLLMIIHQPPLVHNILIHLVTPLLPLLFLLNSLLLTSSQIFHPANPNLQQIPLPENFFHFRGHFKKYSIFNNPAQLNQEFRHLIVIIDPSLLTFKQLYRKHPTQPLLIQVHLLVLTQITIHRWQIILIIHNARRQTDRLQQLIHPLLQFPLHLLHPYLPELSLLLDPLIRLPVNPIRSLIVQKLVPALIDPTVPKISVPLLFLGQNDLLLGLQGFVLLVDLVLEVVLELGEGLGGDYEQAVLVVAGLLLVRGLQGVALVVGVWGVVLWAEVAQYLQRVGADVFINVLDDLPLHVFILQQILFKVLQVLLNRPKRRIYPKALTHELVLLQLLFPRVLHTHSLNSLNLPRKR